MTANTVPDLCSRKLQDEVEDRLADALIRGEIHAKDRVIVTTKNKEIIVSKDKK